MWKKVNGSREETKILHYNDASYHHFLLVNQQPSFTSTFFDSVSYLFIKQFSIQWVTGYKLVCVMYNNFTTYIKFYAQSLTLKTKPKSKHLYLCRRGKYKSVINFKSYIILFRVKYRKPLLVEGIDQLPLDDAAGKNHGGPLQSSNKCFFCQKSVGKKKLCYEI